MIRSYLSGNKAQGRQNMLNLGWQTITVQRTIDDSDNAGVDQEVASKESYKHQKARLDPMETSLNSDKWIGLIDSTDVKVNDIWHADVPEKGIQRFKVTSVKGDEIELDRL